MNEEKAFTAFFTQSDTMIPTISTLEKIATALDVPVSILFDKSQTNETTITCPHCGKSIHLKTE
mgnify:FL=1